MENKVIPSKSSMLQLYEDMLTIRKVELKIEELYKYDEMKTPIHFSLGQEAVAVGMCNHLNNSDYIFGTHRSHAQYIAKGGNLKRMIAELYGRKTGCSMGRGGSMHLVDPEHGILGSSSIVGGNIPLGTGAALASQVKQDGKVSVVFFGDGAAEEGTFHESLNFASLKKLPVLYVCENNFYAVNSHQSQRQVGDNIYKWAHGYDIPGYKIDGNDILAVSRYAKTAIDRCRNGLGPTLIECCTYRWKGHVGIGTDLGNGLRQPAEYDDWINNCPVERFRNYLLNEGILNRESEQGICLQIDNLIDEAFIFAQMSPKPQPEELFDHLYAD